MTKLKDILEGKYEVYFDMGSPGLMSKTVDAKNAKEAEKKVASGLHGKYKIKKVVREVFKEFVKENTCINCGNIVNEDLRKWFKQKWVNIGKKKKGGGHPPCGTSGEKRGYAKCVPASKAASMTKKQKASATRRKRAAQNKAGRGGTSSLRGGGKKPIRVSTKPKK